MTNQRVQLRYLSARTIRALVCMPAILLGAALVYRLAIR